MSAPAPFTVVPGDEFTPGQIVEVLSVAYGKPFTEEWLAWKHHEGPWGPSRCWVAVDDDGILGLMFGLPWRYRTADRVVSGARLVDGGSTPRARGRGVFRGVVARELDQWSPETAPGILVATATPEAAGAHVKNGAVALDPISYAYGPPPRISTARLVTDAAVLHDYCATPGGLSTDWDERALRWRFDPRAGHRYEIAALAQASSANGAVYRVTTVKGVRVVVVLLTWGSPGEVARLLGAIACRTRAPALLGPAGPGATVRPWPAWIRRGCALLCVWPHVEPPLGSMASSRSGWGVTGADIEGVI